MYKKFLVSMLLTVALVGCGHQSSNKQGDQIDTALPIQDQITNPAPDNEATPAANPATAEPTQTPPADSTQPAASATTTPATPDAATTPAVQSAVDAAKDAAAAVKDAAK